ncbi:MAG: S-layer family protein [Cyanobacteria bacterium J06627_28]
MTNRLKCQALLPAGLCASVWLSGETIWGIQPVFAQVSSDRSFGTLVNGSLTERCPTAICTIEGGIQNRAGTSLLHSFEEFSLFSSDQSVLFVDPAVSTSALENILVRVTGGSASLINGAISTSAGSEANLFVVNPAGISFGPAARLSLGGSFVASTAQQLIFDNGALLTAGEATAPTDELLSISAPIGLGFLSASRSAPIELEGPGHFLTFGAPDRPSAFVNRMFQPGTGLSVQPGEAIKLFGNGIVLSGNSLTAAGGEIELGSLSTGRVLFDDTLSTDYRQVSGYADISLAGRSFLETSASNPGRALLRGQNVAVIESSAILAETLPSTPSLPLLAGIPAGIPGNAEASVSGLIDIQATGTVQVSDFSIVREAPPFHSYLSVDVAPDAARPGGTIAIAADRLQVEAGGQLGANTFGDGDAGLLSLDISEKILLSGGSVLGPSGLFSTADILGSGKGGQVRIMVGSLMMDQGARIFTNSASQSAAGSVFITAEQIGLTGTGELLINESAPPLITPTLIQSGMEARSQGQGGSITIETNELLVADGAEISTGTFGRGDAGSLNVTAEAVTLSGFSPVEGPSGLFTTVGFGAAGNGGSLTLETDRLDVRAGAQVATSTAGAGNAGDLFVRGEVVQLSGRTAQGRSGLFATAVGDRGAGGNLTVNADSLIVEEGAAVSVSNFLSGFPNEENAPIPPGQGAAGNLQVSARDISIRDGGLLSADTAVGDRGNIRLQTDLITLRRGSGITTNATGTATGGNIDIEAAAFVVAVPEENSDITANATFGDGGQVNISARQVLGLTARSTLTAQSDITASSDFGISGETRVETVDGEVRPTVEPLPQSAEVARVLEGCAVAGTGTGSGSGRFVQSGQGGLGSSPYGVLNSRHSLADVSVPSALAAPSSAVTPIETPVEAQGWNINEQGQVVLMAAVLDESIGQCSS